jgi:phage FluMu protein Com
MPQKVRCKECEKIIYNSNNLKSVKEIYDIFKGRCPKCGKELYNDFKSISKITKINANEDYKEK